MFRRNEHTFKLGRWEVYALFNQIAVHFGKQIEVTGIRRIEICNRPFSEEETNHRTGAIDSDRIAFFTEYLLQTVLKHVAEAVEIFIALRRKLFQRFKARRHGKRVP